MGTFPGSGRQGVCVLHMADDGTQHAAVNAVAQPRNKVERDPPAQCPQIAGP